MTDIALGVKNVKHIIPVLSGKGGVGKSTVTALLSYAFRSQGYNVGILDVDLCGPSIPKILGINGKHVKDFNGKWVPVYLDEKNARHPVISLGIMSDNDTSPVVWRGPRKTAVISSFFDDVYWGDLDILLIDTPPGTSDEHISVCEMISKFNPDGAILVTTPQGVAVDDVRKEVNFCKKIGISMLGIFENMSGFVCQHCHTQTNIFSSGGGRILSEQTSVPFLGQIPIDPWLCLCEETGSDPFVTKEKDLKQKMADAIKQQYGDDRVSEFPVSDSDETIGTRSLSPLLQFVNEFVKTKGK